MIDPDPYGVLCAAWLVSGSTPRSIPGLVRRHRRGCPCPSGCAGGRQRRHRARCCHRCRCRGGRGRLDRGQHRAGSGRLGGRTYPAACQRHAGATTAGVGEGLPDPLGAVIGADGFGFAPKKGGGWTKIPQLERSSSAIVWRSGPAPASTVARLTTPSSKMAARSIISCKSPIMSGSEQIRPLRPAPASRAARSSASGSRSAEHPASSATSASATMPWSRR